MSSPVSGTTPPPSSTGSSSSSSSSLSPDSVNMNISNFIDSLTLDILTAWNDDVHKMATDNKENEQKSGESIIESNVVSAFPMLVPLVPLNSSNTTSTSAENASQEQSGISGIASDVPVKGSAAVYTFLMTHILDSMNWDRSATASQQVISNWQNLDQNKAVALLAFVAAIQTSQNQSEDDGKDGITNLLQNIKQREANAALEFAHQWLVSIKKVGEELKKIADNKAIMALQEYISSAKDDPSRLDPARLEAVIAMTIIVLLASNSSSLLTTQPETLSSQAITDATELKNPNPNMTDTTAAIVMLAALIAQVPQSQVVLLQLKEQPIDANKISQSFALENAKKTLGFVDDPAYHVYLTKLVANMVGKENLERNVELVKLNMLLNSLWLVSRAEADGTKFSEVMGWVLQYMTSGSTGKKLPFPEGDIRYELLAKIQKKIADFKAQFGPQAALDLKEGLEKMMNFMGEAESKDEIPDPKNPNTYVKFLINTPLSASTPPPPSTPPVDSTPI